MSHTITLLCITCYCQSDNGKSAKGDRANYNEQIWQFFTNEYSIELIELDISILNEEMTDGNVESACVLTAGFHLTHTHTFLPVEYAPPPHHRYLHNHNHNLQLQQHVLLAHSTCKMSDRNIVEFMNATGATPSVARKFLAESNGDLGSAIVSYHTRGQRNASTSNPHRAPRHNFATFSDMMNQEDENQQFFNGGEKSGLAVTNPDDIAGGKPAAGSSNIVDDLISKAKQSTADINAESEARASAPETPSFGQGNRLGTENDPPVASSSATSTASSSYSSSEEKKGSEEEEILHRTMYFWRDGFSIEDGPLYRYDDERNQEYLRAMSMGRAPIELLAAEPHQLVDVHVMQRRDEDYVKPKVAPSLKNSGSGQRLGSVPPESSASSSQAAASASVSASTLASASAGSSSSAGSGAGSAPSSTLGTEGDAAVQIRLADGSARRLRFQSEGPVQQLYDYVAQTTDRAFTLQLPMPPTPLTDKSQSLKSAGVVGAAVVQRWA